MFVKIRLDQRDAPFYTNLDHISGRILLNLPSDQTISAINVKLEGESRTKLATPRDPNERRDRPRWELEVHKVLYKVQTVFPSRDLSQRSASSAQYTLPAGTHEYPFRFRFPFNNDCKNTSNNVLRDLRFGGISLPAGPDSTRHVQGALPPTMGGFPGEAEIAYFVKATVVRPKFYQENFRAEEIIRFMPIEPPRPPDSHQERFARRPHQFQPYQDAPPKRTLFRRSSEPILEGEPLSIKVDARLPVPTILTCHCPIPLRILIERTNENAAFIYLSTLQIQLIGTTTVRAQDLTRQELTSWILLSKANLNLLLDTPDSKVPNAVTVPSALWSHINLPSTIIPSFETCNISRSYALEIRVSIAHGTAAGIRPELIGSTLHFPLQIYSGVAPPQELLNRVNTNSSRPGRLRPAISIPTDNETLSSSSIPAYTSSSPAYTVNPVDLALSTDGDVPPPSYEDAMAEDLPPSDGPRHRFDIALESSNIAIAQSPTFTGDSKSSNGLSRHPSERLFSTNDTPYNLQSQPESTSRHKIKRKAVAQRSNSMSVTPTSTSTSPVSPGFNRHSTSIIGITSALNRISVESDDDGIGQVRTGMRTHMRGTATHGEPPSRIRHEEDIKDKDTFSKSKPR